MAPLPGYQRASRFLNILDKDIQTHLTNNLNKNVLVNIADYILPTKEPEYHKDIKNVAEKFTRGWTIDPDSCWRTPLKRANDHFSDKLYHYSCSYHTYSCQTKANKTLQCQYGLFLILRSYRIEHYNESVICNMLLFKHLWFNYPRSASWRKKILKALDITPSKDHADNLRRAIYSDHLATVLEAAIVDLFAYRPPFRTGISYEYAHGFDKCVLNIIKLHVKKPHSNEKVLKWRR